jgi:hypothetical protein
VIKQKTRFPAERSADRFAGSAIIEAAKMFFRIGHSAFFRPHQTEHI